MVSDSDYSSRYASVGDCIECDLKSYGYRKKLVVKLKTTEACAYGNYLIDSGRWRLVQKVEADRA